MTNIVQVKPVGISWFNHKHMAVDASPVVNQEDNRFFFLSKWWGDKLCKLYIFLY